MELRQSAHQFLKWLPAAVGGSTLAVAGIWVNVRDWIGLKAGEIWNRMDDPWTSGPLVISVLIYVGATVWTGQPKKTSPVPAPPGPLPGPDQLYLFNNPSHDDSTEKAYLIVWSPTENFAITFSDYDSRARQWPPGPPKEKRLTFHLFNAGPEDLRHIEIEWDIGDFDIEEIVRETGLFEGFIEYMSPHKIQLLNEGVGWVERPLVTTETQTIPLLRAGATAAIKAPDAVNYCFSVFALAKAKRMIEAPRQGPTTSMREAVLALQSETVGMEPVILSLDFVGNGSTKHSQSFGIAGDFRGNGHTMSEKPDSGSKNHYSTVDGGITAWIDRIQILKF